LFILPKQPVRGLVLFLHGCSHSGESFFTLPEHKRVTRQALANSLAVAAVTSLDRETGCWSALWPPTSNLDVARVKRQLETLRMEQAAGIAANVPLFLLGASSGGNFASVLARALKVRANVIMIAPAVEEALAPMTASAELFPVGVEFPSPPTAFVFMPRDNAWATTEAVNKAERTLSEQGVATLVVEQHPRPIVATTLQLSTGVSSSTSEEWHRVVQQGGFLDAEGYLKENPLSSEIIRYISGTRFQTEHAQQVPLRVQKEILCAHYAHHELSSVGMERVLQWLLQQ